MASELEKAITQIQKYIATLDGIRAAPAVPPENIGGNYPFVLARPGTGTIGFGPTGVKKALHNIVIELHIARKDLPRDIATALPFCDSIPNLLQYKLLNDNKWNGTVDTFESIAYRFMSWDWEGGIKTVGFEFVVNNVKIQSALTK